MTTYSISSTLVLRPVITATSRLLAAGLLLAAAVATAAEPAYVRYDQEYEDLVYDQWDVSTETNEMRNENALVAVVKSMETATLSSQIDGFVTAVNVVPGDVFSKGDVLLQLDCTLPTAEYNKASAQVEFTRNEYKSLKSLHALNSATKAELGRSAAEFAIAKADQEIAEYNMQQCNITAPFDGTLVEQIVRPFETIQAKSQLLEILGSQSMVVEFLAPSNMVSALTVGLPIDIEVSETGEQHTLTIAKVIPVVDSITQTVKVIASIDTPGSSLWTGMSGWVVIDPAMSRSASATDAH